MRLHLPEKSFKSILKACKSCKSFCKYLRFSEQTMRFDVQTSLSANLFFEGTKFWLPKKLVKVTKSTNVSETMLISRNYLQLERRARKIIVPKQLQTFKILLKLFSGKRTFTKGPLVISIVLVVSQSIGIIEWGWFEMPEKPYFARKPETRK